MVSQNLLIELLVEELPPKALKKLGEAFSHTLFESLKTQGLTDDSSAVTTFATPRRLSAHITQVAAKAADKQIAQKLMPASVGLDANGKATPALVKRLQALGVDESAVAKLRKENDGKAEILFLDAMSQGVAIENGLPIAISDAIFKLPIPKLMTYQLEDGWTTTHFVRPIHGLVALHGDSIVEMGNAFQQRGLKAGRTTIGHRFEAAKPTITIKNADSYAEQLKTEGTVIASYEERSLDIIKQLREQAKLLKTRLEVEPANLFDNEAEEILKDNPLIQEVTALVERPNVLLGQFEKEFLEVPQECLILTMKANQKYFPLLDANGKLTNKFLIVSNINPADPSAVIGGNERVVRPRLADAKFFFDQDRKKTLESRLDGLDKVVYHNKLGSQGERNARVVKIAAEIARQLSDTNLQSKVEFAAKLSKADLLTDMVGEFPELQGIMGRYYAQHEGWDDDVAFAIEDHYRPRFAGDELPRSQVGVVVALADKLETLVGLFGIGEKPTGDKDPFALRRQALGIVRLIIENNLPISLKKFLPEINSIFSGDQKIKKLIEASLLEEMKKSLGKENANNLVFAGTSIQFFTDEHTQQLLSFIIDRLAVNLRDQGSSAQEVDAVLSLAPSLLSEVPKRLEAVKSFANLPEAPALAAANKRVTNILKKVEGEVKAEVNANLLQEAAEKALNDALGKVKPQADKLFESGDYTTSLQALAALKAPVDDFFDHVMVNADDPALKANRLGLLATLHQTMNRVADLSKLAS